MHTPFDEDRCGASVTHSVDLVVIPTAKDIADVCVGGMVVDCFGNLAEVTEVFGRGVNMDGKHFVCFYTRLSANGTVSGSMTEGKLVRHLRLTNKYSSAKLDEIEEQWNHLQDNTHELTCSCGAKFTVAGYTDPGELCASCLEIYK